jgi:hypothetical protein
MPSKVVYRSNEASKALGKNWASFAPRLLWIAVILGTGSIALVGYQTILERSDDHLMTRAHEEFEKQLSSRNIPLDAFLDSCKFISVGGESSVYKIIGCTKEFRGSTFYFAIAFDWLGQTAYVQGDFGK